MQIDCLFIIIIRNQRYTSAQYAQINAYIRLFSCFPFQVGIRYTTWNKSHCRTSVQDITGRTKTSQRLIGCNRLATCFTIAGTQFQVLYPRNVFHEIFLTDTPSQSSRRKISPFIILRKLGRTVSTETNRCQIFTFISIVHTAQPGSNGRMVSTRSDRQQTAIGKSHIPITKRFDVEPFTTAVIVEIIGSLSCKTGNNIQRVIFIKCLGISQRIFTKPVCGFLIVHVSISLPFIRKKILSRSKLALFTVAICVSPSCLKFQAAQDFPFQESSTLKIITEFIHNLIINQSYRIIHLCSIL